MSLKVKIIIACSAAFVISGAVAAGVILTKEDTYRVLKVFEMTGSSVVTREGTGDIDAYIGMNLESGDTVTVGSGSTLRLALDSDKYLMLDSDTILELIASGTAADSRTAINLKQGTILNEITTPLSANSSYEVSAPKATMAVRGTSFTVSVDGDDNGGYTIRENTLNGKVEVTLLDSDGNPTEKMVIVGADKGVTIRTEPDESSGNPAEMDGKSRFVGEDENGNLIELGDGDDPLHEIFYEKLSAKIKENALRSNDEHLMELDELIVMKLRGGNAESIANTDKDTKETASAETAPVTEPAAESVTDNGQESTAAESSSPAVTGVPEAVMSVPRSDVTNAPGSAVSDSPQPQTIPETSAETAPAVSAITPVSAETTVPTDAKPAGTSATTADGTSAVSAVTAPNIGTLPPYTGTVPPYTGTTPSYTGTTPSYTGTTPSYTGTTPSYTGTTPSYTGTTPSYTGTTPSETGTTPSETGTTPTETSTTPSETGTTPSETDTIPSDTGTTPSETGTTAPTSESTAETSATEPEKTVYTVSFMYNGELYSTEKVEEGDKIGNIPEPPAREGYTGKWYLGDNVFTYDTPITSDMIVTAVYTAKTYTVTFTADADTAYSNSIKAAYGETVTVPDVPAKTGHTGKWYVGSTEFTSAYVITSDITVTAKYTPNTYTVTFMVDGSVYKTAKAEYNTPIKETISVPDKEGHTTDGVWYLESDAEFDLSTPITEDITVTAKYTPMEFTVKYVVDLDETIVLSTEQVTYGNAPSEFTPPLVVDKDDDGNYDYYRWGWEETAETVITADTTITVPYAYYDEIYELRINDKGNILYHDLVKKNDTFTLPSPTAVPDEGYEFKGWGLVGSGGTYNTGAKKGTEGSVYEPSDEEAENMMTNEPVSSGSEITLWCVGNTEYRAVYKLKEFTVTIINGTSETVKATYGTFLSKYLPTLPEKDGSTGVWLLTDGTQIDPTTYEVKEDITVTAKYTPNTYTVTYVPIYDETNVLFEETVSFGETPKAAFTPETAVTENGTYKYYLWGWDKVKSELTAVTDNTTVKVPYKNYDDVHEIRVVNEGITIYSGLYINGDTYVLPDPENIPEGNQFMGWGIVYSGGDFATGIKVGTPASEPGDSFVDTSNPKAAGTEVTLDSPIGVLNNTEYRAVYKKLEFTLTIKPLDGATMAIETAQYGDKLAKYVDNTKIWTVDGTVIDPDTYEIKSDITVIQSATIDTQALNEPPFPINDGEFEGSENVPETFDIPEETVPDVTEPVDIPEETAPDVTESVDIPEETSPVTPDITP